MSQAAEASCNDSACRPCLPEPSGPPVVPPDHPMADFYRSGSGAARTSHRAGQKRLQDEEKVKDAITSTLALLDMAITAASMAGGGADDFE
jgi:hypothetical protein